jgi:hypothetical protein
MADAIHQKTASPITGLLPAISSRHVEVCGVEDKEELG